MSANGRVISADSHVVEPPDLWLDRLDSDLRDRAPQVEESHKGFVFGGGGSTQMPVAGVYSAGRNGQDLADFYERVRDAQLYEGARPSGWDPAERMKDQDIDGVSGEVLYPSLGLVLFSMTDLPLQQASFSAYNQWLSEYVAYDAKRLHGIACVSIEDPEQASSELESAKNLGLKGAMVHAQPPLDTPFTSRAYDRFWAAAEELEMPVSLHVATAARKRKTDKGGGAFVEEDPERRKFAYIASFANVHHQMQRSLSALIFSGVFDRFPRLKVVSAEHDIGWIPHFTYRMDHAFLKYREQSGLHLDRTPGEYMAANVWATFQDDPVGPRFAEEYGRDNFMWASDFPHSDSTWPNSLDIIKRDLDPLAPEIRDNIAFNNASTLYRMGL